MATPVFNFIPDYPMGFDWEWNEVVIPMAPGHERIAQNEISYTRADGQGTQSANKGRAILTYTFNQSNFGGDQQMLSIRAFLWARKNLKESFHVYDLAERTTPDGG